MIWLQYLVKWCDRWTHFMREDGEYIVNLSASTVTTYHYSYDGGMPDSGLGALEPDHIVGQYEIAPII